MAMSTSNTVYKLQYWIRVKFNCILLTHKVKQTGRDKQGAVSDGMWEPLDGGYPLASSFSIRSTNTSWESKKAFRKLVKIICVNYHPVPYSTHVPTLINLSSLVRIPISP